MTLFSALDATNMVAFFPETVSGVICTATVRVEISCCTKLVRLLVVVSVTKVCRRPRLVFSIVKSVSHIHTLLTITTRRQKKDEIEAHLPNFLLQGTFSKRAYMHM